MTPFFHSLEKAVELYLADRQHMAALKLERWAETYRCKVSDVQAEFAKQERAK